MFKNPDFRRFSRSENFVFPKVSRSETLFSRRENLGKLRNQKRLKTKPREKKTKKHRFLKIKCQIS